jgi:hypothetical protein
LEFERAELEQIRKNVFEDPKTLEKAQARGRRNCEQRHCNRVNDMLNWQTLSPQHLGAASPLLSVSLQA